MRCTCHYGDIVECRLELGAKRRRLELALSILKKRQGYVHLALSWKLDRFVERGHWQQHSGLDWHYVLLGLLISFVHLYLASSPSPLPKTEPGLTLWQLISVRESVLVHFHPFSKIHIRIFHFSSGIITFSSCVFFPYPVPIGGTGMRCWSFKFTIPCGCTRCDTGMAGWEVFEDVGG
jgi:hypothetical protein